MVSAPIILVSMSQGYEKMFSIKVERGQVTQIKGGAIHHDSLIGKQYGARVGHQYFTHNKNYI